MTRVRIVAEATVLLTLRRSLFRLEKKFFVLDKRGILEMPWVLDEVLESALKETLETLLEGVLEGDLKRHSDGILAEDLAGVLEEILKDNVEGLIAKFYNSLLGGSGYLGRTGCRRGGTEWQARPNKTKK